MGRPKILSARDVRRLRRSIVLLQMYKANLTVKEIIRFCGLQYSSVSYATFYREILRASFKFLNSRKKGVLSDCNCVKRYRFAQKCSKILRMNSDLFHSSISFYLDGVSFIFKRKPNHSASVPKGKIWHKRSKLLLLTKYSGMACQTGTAYSSIGLMIAK